MKKNARKNLKKIEKPKKETKGLAFPAKRRVYFEDDHLLRKMRGKLV